MIYLKTEAEIEKMRFANQVVAAVLKEMHSFIRPGISTLDIDRKAESIIRAAGAEPSFLGYGHPPFPASVCVSLNEEVVHGIPRADRIIREGDVVSVDCGALLNGWQGDAARTYIVGEVPERVRELVKVTEECFWKGLEQAVVGKRVGDISAAIQSHAEAHGFSVILELTGHGIANARRAERSERRSGGSRPSLEGRHGAGRGADDRSR